MLALLVITLELILAGGIYLCVEYFYRPCRHEGAYPVKAGALTQTPKAQHERNKMYVIKKDSRWCPLCQSWLDLDDKSGRR